VRCCDLSGGGRPFAGGLSQQVAVAEGSLIRVTAGAGSVSVSAISSGEFPEELNELLADVSDVPAGRDGFTLVTSLALDFSLSADYTVRIMEGFSAHDIASRCEALARLAVITGAADDIQREHPHPATDRKPAETAPRIRDLAMHYQASSAGER